MLTLAPDLWRSTEPGDIEDWGFRLSELSWIVWRKSSDPDKVQMSVEARKDIVSMNPKLIWTWSCLTQFMRRMASLFQWTQLQSRTNQTGSGCLENWQPSCQGKNPYPCVCRHNNFNSRSYKTSFTATSPQPTAIISACMKMKRVQLPVTWRILPETCGTQTHYGEFDDFFMKKLPRHIWPPEPF